MECPKVAAVVVANSETSATLLVCLVGRKLADAEREKKSSLCLQGAAGTTDRYIEGSKVNEGPSAFFVSSFDLGKEERRGKRECSSPMREIAMKF